MNAIDASSGIEIFIERARYWLHTNIHRGKSVPKFQRGESEVLAQVSELYH